MRRTWCAAATSDRARRASARWGYCAWRAGQASIVMTGWTAREFMLNFMTDYVNATNGEAEAYLQGDTWTVTVDGKEVYEVPRAAIEVDESVWPGTR